MINRLIGCALRNRPTCHKESVKLPRRLLRSVFAFAILANVTATSNASFGQSLGAVPVSPDDASTQMSGHSSIVSARDPRFQAIGQLIGPMPCTGAIVLHPRIVLTAARCVIERASATPSRTLLFRPAYQGEAGVGAFEARVVAVGSIHQLQAQSIHEASQDWAILVLDKGAAGVRPLAIAEYTPQELQSMYGRVLMPSYSRDTIRGWALSVDPSCSIEGVKWEVLVHNCVIGRGAVGAPLLVRNGDCYAVVGIHSGAMLVEDHRNHLQRVGNSAVGTWNFHDPLHTLVSQLNAEKGIEEAKTRASRGCSSAMVVALARRRRISSQQ